MTAECSVLVPGFATLTTIRTPHEELLRVVNLYLHPGHQTRIWQRVSAMLPANAPEDPAMLLIGDLNTNLAVETPVAGSLVQQIVAQWGLLRTTNPTRRG